MLSDLVQRQTFIAYHVLYITDEEREKIFIRFEEYIVNLDN